MRLYHYKYLESEITFTELLKAISKASQASQASLFCFLRCHGSVPLPHFDLNCPLPTSLLSLLCLILILHLEQCLLSVGDQSQEGTKQVN